MSQPHYLEAELTDLVQSDDAMWTFLQAGSLDGVWYWDLEKPDHEWMSPEFWRLFGIDPATKAHNPAEWQDIIFAEDLAVALENFTAHCADPDHPYDQIVRYRHADGSTVWVRCRGLAIRDADGKPVRMLGAHNDITAVKQSELAAQRGWASTRDANAELKAFAYSMSHDMKAPASTLHLLLSELKTELDGKYTDEAAVILRMSFATVDRIKGLVEDVLEYSRVVGMDTQFETVALDDAAADAIAALNTMIEEADATITVAPLPSLTAIRPQAVQLFQNLIENALKFRSPDRKPKIEITAHRDAETREHLISIKDNGIGIPVAKQHRIFTLFQRLHTRDEIEGNGIGLSLCQRILVNHRGALTVTSAPDEGATFVFSIPEERP